MSFHPDGTLPRGRRPNQPPGWRQTPGMVLHHMIDWSTLRATWNRMVAAQRREELVRYLGLIGYGDRQSRQRTVDAVLGGRIGSAELADRDDLEMRICWQRYNLFEGPTAESRQAHSPDPGRMLEYFRDVGATTFDFPIVAPPHGQRANTLWRAFRHLQSFLDGGDPGQLQSALTLVESVRDAGVIAAYEVNWFGLAQKRFWAMSRSEKRRYFEACTRRGWREVDGDAVYAEVFGKQGFARRPSGMK